MEVQGDGTVVEEVMEAYLVLAVVGEGMEPLAERNGESLVFRHSQSYAMRILFVRSFTSKRCRLAHH
jgi:hypothetical protein